MNQDKIMKRRMITAICLMIISFIALAVFIGLYIDETHRVQDSYKKQFRTELGHAAEETEIYLDAEGGKDLIYRRITMYMGNASSFAFLIEDFTDQQRIINEVSTALMKYPEQMSGKISDLKTAVNDILADLDKGYDEMKAIFESLDLKGY